MVDLNRGRFPLLYCDKLIPIFAEKQLSPAVILTKKVEVLRVNARPGRLHTTPARPCRGDRASDNPRRDLQHGMLDYSGRKNVDLVHP